MEGRHAREDEQYLCQTGQAGSAWETGDACEAGSEWETRGQRINRPASPVDEEADRQRWVDPCGYWSTCDTGRDLGNEWGACSTSPPLDEKN